MDGWNIVPFGMAYIQVRTVRFRVYYNRRFFSAKERLTSGLSAEAELRRSGGGSLDARGGSTSLVAWREAWLAVCLGPGPKGKEGENETNHLHPIMPPETTSKRP